MSAEVSKANIARLEEKDQFISGIIAGEIQKSERTLSSWKKKLLKYNELYKMVQNNKHYVGLANIFVPEILRAVETVVGNLYKIIVGQHPWFEYEGRSDNDEPAAVALTQLTNWQMDENKFKIRLLDSLRQMAISGLTVRKILWDFEQVNQRKKVASFDRSADPITGKLTTKKKVKTEDNLETTKDHWTFEPVDLLGFHISDVATPYHDIQKAKWIAEQYIVEMPFIRNKIKKGWFVELDDDEELEETASYNSSDSERYKNDRKQSSGYSTMSYGGKKGIEIIERWGLIAAKYVYTDEERKELELEKDDLVESIIVIANRKVILKLEANPFWHNQKPYVSCPYVAQDNEFSGMGVSQIGEKLQEELNDTRNQVMDNKTMILMNMWLKERSAGINNKDLRVRPMGVILTNNINGLKPLAPPVLAGVGVNIEGVIKNDLRESVGAASNLQGIAQSGVSTATESTQINQASFGRLLLTAQQYAELILKPTLKFSEILNYQYYDTAKVIRIVGEQGVKYVSIEPDDIVGHKDPVISLGTDIDDNPGIRRQQLLQFLTIVQTMPPQVMEYHWHLLDKIYKSFFPMANSLADIYTPPPGEEQLLTPEEEFDLMAGETPVQVKRGDDDQEHLREHEKDMEMTRFSLSPTSFDLLKKHIMEHHQQMAAKVQEQSQQAEAAMAPQQGGQPGGLNTGQMPGVSAFTNSTPNKASDLARNLGGQ